MFLKLKNKVANVK